jgi:phosphoglycerol transferase MdoB-like AlkP superfamily enzyme
MSRRKIFKHRGFVINMLACLAFLLLAVYGWHMPVSELLHYFLIIVVSLAVMVGVAFGAGWVLRKLMHRDDDLPK